MPTQEFRISTPLHRRAFLRHGTLCLAGLGGALFAKDESGTAKPAPAVRVGIVTDLHYADKESTKTRFYRETPRKLEEVVQRFNAEKPDFVVELGDLIDQAATVEQEIAWLDEIEKVFAKVTSPRHYVLGNHCVATLTKAEFIAHTGASKTSHYSFDHGGVHFVILDACYRSDGEPYGRSNAEWTDANIPAAELAWLREDLKKHTSPVVVFAHQRLDEADKHSVKNAAEVRAVLEASGHVSAVLQGHSHKNAYQQVNGIHYVTLAALIEGSGEENNSYGMLEVMSNGALRIKGYRKMQARELEGVKRKA
ncbi:metallophosphoesterase family protein [Roseimicrobium gellanilyticum]|nr:metallophosphoesterase [Roseimicrobium gellanilyticum]